MTSEVDIPVVLRNVIIEALTDNGNIAYQSKSSLQNDVVVQAFVHAVELNVKALRSGDAALGYSTNMRVSGLANSNEQTRRRVLANEQSLWGFS